MHVCVCVCVCISCLNFKKNEKFLISSCFL